jgi:3-methyladenine DNA glycosylase AlkD
MAKTKSRQTSQRAAAVIRRMPVRPAPDTPSAARLAELALKGLYAMGSAEIARTSAWFFKTAPGEYGAHDKFIGIRVPQIRKMAREMKDAGVEVAMPLLKSSWHEARALALILLVRQFQRGDDSTREKIFNLYMRNRKFINNWDLVDMSAPHIVGAWLADKPAQRKSILTTLATSHALWERRISILATLHYIKQGEYKETLRLASLLLRDDEDLIQKAVGWMLREVGKHAGLAPQEEFMQRTYRDMPRVMLRYAIERFPVAKRKRYLQGLV